MRFLFVDRIVASSPAEWVRGVKHITAQDTYLTQDEQGKACFIPSLIGETLGQLAAWNVMQHNGFTLRPVAGVVSSAQLHRPAYVGETLFLESYIDSVDDAAVQYHSLARVNQELVFSIEGALGPLLPMDDFIDNAIIQQQFAEIYTLDKPSFRELNTTAGCSASKQNILPMTFDRIISSQPGLAMAAEKQIRADAPYFPDHFPKKPVLPLTVLLECKLNLAKEFVRQAGFTNSYEVTEFRKIKMSEFVPPGAVLLCSLKVKEHNEQELILNFKSEVNDKRVCVVDVVLHAKGKSL